MAITLKKGLDIPISGFPRQEIDDVPHPAASPCSGTTLEELGVEKDSILLDDFGG